MRIGYPCINLSIGCTSSSTFRLANYTADRMEATVKKNLDCLMKVLKWNMANNIYFFRMSSDLIPFASHPICRYDWKNQYLKQLKQIGNYVKRNKMRVSMHPDQFIVLNSNDADIVKRSIAELEYHATLMDAMGLDRTMKIQLHVGGVYGDKDAAKQRFVMVYKGLPDAVKKRLVVENDERLYTVQDCLDVSRETGIPVVVDTLHHACNNQGEGIREVVKRAAKTWKRHDGLPIVDYSTQARGEKIGKHAAHIDIKDFKNMLKETEGLDFDIMLEIKDKEKSALLAIKKRG